MRRFAIGGMLLVIAHLAGPSLGAEEPSTEALTVMTYNLRYASDRPPNSWPQRRPVAKAMLAETAPDLIGTQEGLYAQLKDLAADLPDYEWIGLGREGGRRGEFMAVFYRRARLEPLEYDHYWLSDTPDVIGSTTWGNSVRRMVTWVRFRDLATQREFYFINTHFDHQVQPAREKSARLVRERSLALPGNLPMILVGDFNAAAEANPAYHTLVADDAFADAWLTAGDQGEHWCTFHGFETPRREGPRIDWILTRGNVESLSAEVVTYSQDGQHPSDHFPVLARIRVGP